MNTIHTCRICGEFGFRQMVKYGVRHYAHFACYLDAGKRLSDLHPWQVGQFPWKVLKDRGLTEQVELILKADAA